MHRNKSSSVLSLYCVKTKITAVALSVMAACTLLYTGNTEARTYSFDASMLKGGGKGVDLTLFEEGAQLPGIYPERFAGGFAGHGVPYGERCGG